jgi:IS30 family transposase
MKIQLPNGSRLTLNENITLDEKQQVVEDLTEQWMPTIISNWDSQSVRFFLDNLANYLVWHKEEDSKNKQDKEVLSIKRIEEMEGKRQARSIPFTSLSKTQKEAFGLDGEMQ